MTAAPNVSPPPAADAPPAPVPIERVDPLSFVEDAPAFSAETIAVLATPVNPDLVEARATQKDGPEKLLFVPWVHYQAILLKAFGPGGYRMVPRAVARQEGNVVTWVGALFVRPPGERKFQFIKEAKGECGMHGGMTMGNAAEGAQSDCLVKCCKGLGIFMELFDPAWRAAWERNHRGAYEARKRKADWRSPRAPASPAAALGASPTSALGASPTSAPTAPAGSSAAPAEGPASAPPSSSSAGPATPDTGEAATPEQLDAIKSRVKNPPLAWKLPFARIWFARHFGLATDSKSADGILGQLTAQQADTAMLLLTAFGTNVYATLLAQQQERGACR